MSKSGSHQRRNKWVRENVPGGNTTLGAIELLHKMLDRHDERTEAGKILRLALTSLNQIANEMRDAYVKPAE